MSSYTLRPARDADVEWMFGLHELVFRPHIEAAWGWEASWQRENFRREFDLCASSIIVAGGHDVGYLEVLEEADCIKLYNIAIHPRYQGRGIGGSILESLQSQSASRRVPLVLRVFRTNHRALAFYLRLGFVQASQTEAQLELTWRAE